MNLFEFKAKRAELEAKMMRTQADLFNYLVKIDLNVRYAEMYASFPDAKNYQSNEYSQEEKAAILLMVERYRKLSESLYAMKDTKVSTY